MDEGSISSDVACGPFAQVPSSPSKNSKAKRVTPSGKLTKKQKIKDMVERLSGPSYNSNRPSGKKVNDNM